MQNEAHSEAGEGLSEERLAAIEARRQLIRPLSIEQIAAAGGDVHIAVLELLAKDIPALFATIRHLQQERAEWEQSSAYQIGSAVIRLAGTGLDVVALVRAAEAYRAAWEYRQTHDGLTYAYKELDSAEQELLAIARTESAAAPTPDTDTPDQGSIAGGR